VHRSISGLHSVRRGSGSDPTDDVVAGVGLLAAPTAVVSGDDGASAVEDVVIRTAVDLVVPRADADVSEPRSGRR
jgi:hypothetical protein